MKKNLLILTCCLLFFQCTAFNIKREPKSLPPLFIQKSFLMESDSPEEIERQLRFITERYSTNQHIEWWITYKKALIFKKEEPNVLCENMHFLSQIQDFPLRPYAHLYFYSECTSDITIKLENFPDWLKKKAALMWLTKAREQKDTSEIIEASYRLYQLFEEKDLREQYLLTAIKWAKDIGDPRLEEWRLQLYTLSPRYISNPDHSQKLLVAHDYRRKRLFSKATLYYRQLLNTNQSTFNEKNESFKWMRWIYKNQKKHKSHLRATRQWNDWLKKEMANTKHSFLALKSYYNNSILLARSQWTLNKTPDAIKTLNDLEREVKNRISLFTAYRLKALIYAEQNDLEKSIFYFQKAFNETAPDKETKEKTQWNYAWILKKNHQNEKSISTLESLLSNTESRYLPSRITFWIGQIYESQKQIKKAKKSYNEVIESNPFSYYGLLSHYKTQLRIHLPLNKDFTPKANEDEEYLIAFWLISIGDYESALEFLKFKAKEFQINGDKNKTMSRSFVYYMSKARSYLPLFQMVGNLPMEERKRFFQHYTQLLFPMIYEEEVTKAFELFSIDKELIYSVIRQESAFNTRARSPADAFGLMQVIPSTARNTAKRSGVFYQKVRDLYKPETNILIGTAFLKHVFKRYDYHFIPAIAAYNAGPTVVNQWLQRTTASNSLSFIEEIPYEETRNYVRLLIRNFVLYKLLHNPGKSILFPEWILQMNISKRDY